jgi:hypothetical protein
MERQVAKLEIALAKRRGVRTSLHTSEIRVLLDARSILNPKAAILTIPGRMAFAETGTGFEENESPPGPR